LYEDPKVITALMLIIDSAREVQVGVAPHFPPVTLRDNEIMMNQELFDYLNLKVGDPAVVEIEIPNLENMDYYMKAFAMLTHELDYGMEFDLRNRAVRLPETENHPALNITMKELFGSDEKA
jgi:hypothetical protein